MFYGAQSSAVVCALRRAGAEQPRRECPVRAECPLCAWRTSPTAQSGDVHQSKWKFKSNFSDHP